MSDGLTRKCATADMLQLVHMRFGDLLKEHFIKKDNRLVLYVDNKNRV